MTLDIDILSTVEKAKQDAITYSFILFIDDCDINQAYVIGAGEMEYGKDSEQLNDELTYHEAELFTGDDFAEENETYPECANTESTEETTSENDDRDDDDEIIIDDLNKLSSVTADIQLKGYGDDNCCLNENGPFVLISQMEKDIVIRKSSLVWLLTETNNKLSADRLKHVQNCSNVALQSKKNTNRIQEQTTSGIVMSDEISLGE